MAGKPNIHTVETIKSRTIEEGDCWLWQGCLQAGTTPYMSFMGKVTNVRKAMWLLQGKNVQNGTFFWSTCGDSRCVNPAHTVQRRKSESFKALSEVAQSPEHRAKRVRSITIARRKMYAKLTKEDVTQIRLSDDSHRELAERFGVDRRHIGDIKRGTRWREVSNPFAGLMG